MHAGRGLFGNAAPFLHDVVPAGRILGMHSLEQIFDDLLFFAARRSVDPVAAFFEFVAFVDQQRHVAAVVNHQLRALALRVEHGLQRAVPVLFERLALPGEHRHAGRGNRRRRMILRRKDVAARPAHIRAEVHQRFNQHRRLNRHVQRSGDADARERFVLRVLLANGHQARHLVLGDRDLFAAPVGQRQVGDFVFRCDSVQCCSAHRMPRLIFRIDKS